MIKLIAIIIGENYLVTLRPAGLTLLVSDNQPSADQVTIPSLSSQGIAES
jgi:hypothetical protein